MPSMASHTNFLVLFFLAFAFSIYVSDAFKWRPLRHYVNGRQGWVLHPYQAYNNWAAKGRFLVNDTLFFRYDKEDDSVLEVTKQDYDTCNTTTNPIRKGKGGKTEFVLDHSGPFYFISGNRARCEEGEKMTVTVLSLEHLYPPPTVVPAPPEGAPGTGQPPVGTPPSGGSQQGGVPPATSPSSGTPSASAPATSPSTGTSPSSGTPVATAPATSPSGATATSPASEAPVTSGSATTPSAATSPRSSSVSGAPGTSTAATPVGGAPAQSGAVTAAAPGENPADGGAHPSSAGIRSANNGYSMTVGILSVLLAVILQS